MMAVTLARLLTLSQWRKMRTGTDLMRKKRRLMQIELTH